jgi:hypothetical protein
VRFFLSLFSASLAYRTCWFRNIFRERNFWKFSRLGVCKNKGILNGWESGRMGVKKMGVREEMG